MLRRRQDRAWVTLPVLVLLLSCGGGEPEQDEASTADDGRAKAQAFVPPGPVPTDAHINGMWSQVYPWPIIAVHSVLLPDGRVLTYGSDTTGLQTGHANVDVWDGTGPTAD